MPRHDALRHYYDYDRPTGEAGRHIGYAATREILRGIEPIPQISPERKATFTPIEPGQKYGLFCADDRHMTLENAALLERGLGIDPEAYLRYFGGVMGLGRVLKVTLAAQRNSQTFNKLGPDVVENGLLIAERISKTTGGFIQPGVHCAQLPESSPRRFDPNLDRELGCKYCAAMGVITCLCQDEKLVELAKIEQAALFGNSQYIDIVTQGNADFEKRYAPEGPSSLSVTGEQIGDANLPVSLLKGKHASIKKDGVIVVENYTLDQISRPEKANAHDVPFYNNDMTKVAEILIRAYPKFDINPRTLLAVMDHDIRATRAALAGMEGLEARDMALQIHGSPHQAIEYLEYFKAQVESR